MSTIAEALKAKKDKEVQFVYTGDYRLVDKKAQTIPKVGDEYRPLNADQVEELEFQISRGIVFKTPVVEAEES